MRILDVCFLCGDAINLICHDADVTPLYHALNFLNSVISQLNNDLQKLASRKSLDKATNVSNEMSKRMINIHAQLIWFLGKRIAFIFKRRRRYAVPTNRCWHLPLAILHLHRSPEPLLPTGFKWELAWMINYNNCSIIVLWDVISNRYLSFKSRIEVRPWVITSHSFMVMKLSIHVID